MHVVEFVRVFEYSVSNGVLNRCSIRELALAELLLIACGRELTIHSVSRAELVRFSTKNLFRQPAVYFEQLLNARAL